MRLTESFIRRPVATIMLNASLLVFGLIALQRLPVRELPDIDPSIVNVLTVYPGASAEVVETEVTERLEESISGAESIKLIRSESREQVSSIAVEFIQGRDVDLAAQDVRDLVSRVRGDLPEDIEEPVISKQDSGAQPIIWVAFFSDRHTVEELTHIADTTVKDRLQTVPGVSSVIFGGEKKRAIRIRLDAQLMASRGVTVLDVERRLRADNVELPSGRVENIDREMTVRTLGELKTPEEFNRLVIRQDAEGVIRLEDIGWAEMGVEDERSRARYKGRPAIGLGIIRQSRSNTLTVAQGAKERMADLAHLLPDGVEYDFPYDESIYVGRAIAQVWETLGIAFALVVLTIFLFLRSIRSTFVPALAIPVSIGATFGVLYLLGLTINVFTLLALVLAIGIVVDDAIVVLENVHRHVEEGKPPFEAAIVAIGEIAFAVITTTLSLVAVFLPLAFIGGITGRLLVEFAVALSAAVIVSSIVALTLSPMVAARVLKPIEKEKHGRVYNWLETKFTSINKRYERDLSWSLKHRWAIIVIALLSLGLSTFFFAKLEREFLPQEDKGRFFGLLLAPEGSTPDYTDRMVRQVETIFDQEPGIQSYFTAVALPFDGPGQSKMGVMFVRLKDGGRKHIRDMVNGPTGLGGRMFGEVEGALAFPILPKAVDIGFSQPFELVLSHPDLDKLNAYTQELIGRFQQEGFLTSPRSPFEINKPELSVIIDRDRAADLGIPIRDLSRTIQILFGGEDLSSIKIGGKQYDVIVQLERRNRLTPDQMDQLYIRASDGQLVQLGSVATLKETAAPTVIERFGRQRSATIEAAPAGVPLGTAVDRAEAILAETMPPGFSYDWKGEARDLRESSRDIYGFMLLAIIVVYMVLGAQFESFASPFVVMLALPLAFLGAFGSLSLLSWINGVGTGLYEAANFMPDASAMTRFLSRLVPRIPAMNLNIFSQVGLILLIGMVTKNSILLVEFANQQRAAGKDARAAMLQAGLIRLRPILMTSMATIAGILPIAIGIGDAAESRRPLGVVCVGGLITSTLLTLFVIPVMYTVLADLGRRRAERKSSRGSEKLSTRTLVTTSLVLALATLPTLTGRADESVISLPQQLGLSDAVSLSLEHNPELAQTRERIRERDGELREYRAAGRPRLTLSGDYVSFDDGTQQSFGSGMAPEEVRWSADAEAAITVFSGYQNRSRVKATKNRKEADHAVLASTSNDLVVIVHEAYYDALLARENVRVQEEAIVVLTEQLKITKSRFEAGRGAKFDVTQARVALANARPPLIRANNDYRRSVDRLRQLIGLPYPENVDAEEIELKAVPTGTEITFSLDSALEKAAQQRPELAEVAALVRAERQDITTTSRENRPIVDLFAGYGAENDQFGEEDVLQGWTGGARITWPLFSGGARAGRVEQARSQLNSLEFRLKELNLAVEGDVRLALYDYQEARDILATAALVVEQAQESLTLARNRFEAGRGTQLDVLESQLQLTRAKLENSTALRNSQMAVVRMRRAIGEKL